MGDGLPLLDIMARRRSIRAFTDQPVPEDLLNQVLEGLRLAPSAGNRQQFRVLVVSNQEMIAKMTLAVREVADNLIAQTRGDLQSDVRDYAGNFSHFAGAPVVLVPVYRDDARGSILDLTRNTAGGATRSDSLQSVSAGIQNMLLIASTLGLGACWMTGPLIAEIPLASLLAVPEGWRIAALVPLGYPETVPSMPPRRSLERLVTRID